MKIDPKRSYRQTARASAAQNTEDAILLAFDALLREAWYDEITLDDVAAKAGTTRQTVIRRFGGKTGLLAAFTGKIGETIEALRATAPVDDVAGAVAVLVADYETTGDMVTRLLSLEGRIPEIEPTLETGRAGHRRWVETTFSPRLAHLQKSERDDRLAQLLVATDVWTWLLFRRTQKRSVAQTKRLMTSMISRLLDDRKDVS